MKKLLLPAITICALAISLSGCSFSADRNDNNDNSGTLNTEDNTFVNPGDSLGGGGTATYQPTATEGYSDVENSAIAITDGIDTSYTSVPADAQHITKKVTISSAGSYYIDSEISGKISVEAEGVTLYLNGATLTNEKKVIESTTSLTITLIGDNSITNTNESGTNAIDCDGALIINGEGSLSVTSTKNAIKANSISVADASLVINAQKDGLHAEISAYDDLTTAPTFSYDDGGFVFIDGATINITAADDGIQADTFVYIKGDADIDITSGGGAPQKVTEQSSDNADGKGIKAGNIDWGADDTELTSGDYLILIEGGDINVNSNDDAVHSNSRITISGGTLTVSSGDDGVHADDFIGISNGSITVTKCYEGVEAAKVEISGGSVDVTSVDDGINAADGTTTRVNVANNNCHIIISGGEVTVDAEGDGLDSNGSMLISGGKVFVMGPTSGDNAALDADGSIVVNGGYLFAAGPLGMVETPASNSQQNVISFARNSAIAANTIVTLADSDGAIVSCTVTKACQSLIISCPEITKGSSYTLYGGDSTLSTFTVSSTITTIGSSSSINSPNTRPNIGGFGGMGGFGRW